MIIDVCTNCILVIVIACNLYVFIKNNSNNYYSKENPRKPHLVKQCVLICIHVVLSIDCMMVNYPLLTFEV